MSDSDGSDELPNLVLLQKQWMSLPGWAGSTIDLPFQAESGSRCGESPSTVLSMWGATEPQIITPDLTLEEVEAAIDAADNIVRLWKRS